MDRHIGEVNPEPMLHLATDGRWQRLTSSRRGASLHRGRGRRHGPRGRAFSFVGSRGDTGSTAKELTHCAIAPQALHGQKPPGGVDRSGSLATTLGLAARFDMNFPLYRSAGSRVRHSQAPYRRLQGRISSRPPWARGLFLGNPAVGRLIVLMPPPRDRFRRRRPLCPSSGVRGELLAGCDPCRSARPPRPQGRRWPARCS
jgi:hypothetical protein